MNIILSGYGKMGKAVETAASERGHTILAKFDRPADWAALAGLAGENPVVIDFSQPEMVKQNILTCFQHHVPVVVGTTGWNDQLPAVVEACRAGKNALLTASNFSIGMNLFFAVNKYLASLMDKQLSYEVTLEETHHMHKLDKPSGTAITLAEQIIQKIGRKNEWKLDRQEADHQVRIDAFREGEVFGDHRVFYNSLVDCIEIRHTAKSRMGFALGAVLAAEWIQGRIGYFEMSDFLGI